MTITLYSFSKRENSTKLPPASGNAQKEVNVVLKEDCSDESPIFILSRTAFFIDGYTYANYVKFQNAYYWVDSFKYISNDQVEVHCSKDVLATFKSAIGNESFYVLRSSASFDGNLIDTLYPVKTGVTRNTVAHTQLWTYDNDLYVLGFINTSGVPVGVTRGAVSYVLCSYQMILNFINQFNPLIERNADFNPFNYIVSCKYYPLVRSTTSTNTFSMMVGDLAVYLEYYTGIVEFTSKTITATFTDHPQIARGEYLNHAPYAKYIIYAGPFGNIEIPTDAIYTDFRTFRIQIDYEVTTGTAFLNIYNNTSATERDLILRTSCILSPDITLSKENSGGSIQNWAHFTAGMIGAGLGLATLNPGSIISSGMSAVDSAVNIITPRLNIGNVANGSIVALWENLTIVEEFYPVANDDNANFGRPLCQKKIIKNIAGYIVCKDAHFQINGAHLDEIKKVESYLNTGFFYE